MARAYYNEIDPFAAAWLRELIKAGHIAPGIVDGRSIEDVCSTDLAGFTQCHFFAGIGVWSYALRCAGWPDDRPVWTGSCPCQPFSAAGKGGGFADERHLWPAFFHLISQRRPLTVFGEQVASRDGLLWLDLVQADLEGAGYACGAVDTCAAGFGAPHIRQRLYWVADSHSTRLAHVFAQKQEKGRAVGRASTSGRLDNSGGNGRHPGRHNYGQDDRREPCAADTVCRLADAYREPGCAEHERKPGGRHEGPAHLAKFGGDSQAHGALPTNGLWRDADWLRCRDGKWRPVEPGTFPLAHGAASRVGRLRGYGNAINAAQAQAFIEAAIPLLGAM